jgi:hypothetical protein
MFWLLVLLFLLLLPQSSDGMCPLSHLLLPLGAAALQPLLDTNHVR